MIMKERESFSDKLRGWWYLWRVVKGLLGDKFVLDVDALVEEKNKQGMGELFLIKDEMVEKIRGMVDEGKNRGLGWQGEEIDRVRLVGYLEEFTDRFDGEVDWNIFPPEVKVKELVNRVLESRDRVGVVEILEFSLELSDSKLMKALLLAWATTRLMARSFDRKVYSGVGLGGRGDEFNWELTERWWDKLIPFPGEGKNDPMGDYYYFFTLLVGGVIGGEVRKLIVEVGPEVMVWARKRAGSPTLTPHATAIEWAREILSYNT